MAFGFLLASFRGRFLILLVTSADFGAQKTDQKYYRKMHEQGCPGSYSALGVEPLKENKQPAARALGTPGCYKGC